ncbi:unnamed protein product [Microthlaspi erraticum]|uniref:apyrase n=1 Tax=Microthlaspi erraticum TaxID=1685480 RepID=A0A6D2K9F7_9BRAS|nr:unnamed protein product [Microthlaspi erraticum]
MISAVKSALRDMVFTFFWVNLSATFGIQAAAIVSATGLHGITWAPPVIIILIVFVSISVFSVIGDFIGGASFNPCGNAAFYTAGVSKDSLFSLAIRSPAQALGAAGGAITIMEMIPEKYKTMIGGAAVWKVDAHNGAIAEVILSFCITFLVLLIILRGPRKMLAKTFLLAIATVSVFMVGSNFTRPFMNPALAFGWSYIHKSHNTWKHFYVYWISSYTGAILSAMFFRLLFPLPPPNHIVDLEPLQDPPQTTASSGTGNGNGKIRYRSPSSTELLESGTANASSGQYSPPSSDSHQGLLSVDGGKMTAKRGIGRHESIADKIQRHRGILLLISVPIVLIGLVLVLMPGRSGSDAVVEEYTVHNRKGGPNSRGPKNYAVIFDAGSSGSRVHVYCFDQNLDLLPLGNELELFLQLKPGLSAYPTDPRQAANSLVSLLDKAEASVPRELRPKTLVRVGATAGLRTLGHEASENILQAVRELLRDRSMLKTEANGVTVLDGTQEGSYQWVTINYLLRNLGKPYSDTVGVVDLGGGSVQMAYAISEEDAANAPKPLEGEDTYVREMYLKGRKYFLYVHSYLHYGLLAARAEILKVSEDSNNPCIVTGYDGTYKYGGKGFKAAASQPGASLDECRRITLNALKVNDTLCTHMKCTFGGVWNGGRGGGQKNMFVASFFFDRAAEAGFVDPEKPVATVRPLDFEKAAKKACSMKLEEGKSKFPRVEEENLPYLCMDLVYQFTLLTDGFGLEASQTITLVKKVKYGEHAVEAAWPLGSAIEAVSSP